jgi:hypothetical protein
MNVALNAKQAKLFKLALSGPPPLPRICTTSEDTAGNFAGSGTNGIPGWSYLILASSNLTKPFSSWTVVATNYFDGAGNFAFTNTNLRTPDANFQILQVP